MHSFDFLISFYTGYLHKLGGKRAIHEILNELAKQYGDVFSMHMGNRLVVVLSSKDAIQESLIEKPKQFSGRPDFTSFMSLVEGSSGLIRCNVTRGYQQNKLLIVRGWQDLFSDRKLFDNLMNKEAEKVQHLFDDLVLNSSLFFPQDYLTVVSPAMMLGVLFGGDISYSDPELLWLVKSTIEVSVLSASSPLRDFLNYPIIQIFPNPTNDQLTKVRKAKIQFYIRKINEYLDNEEKIPCMLSSFLANFHRDLTVENITANEIHEMALLMSDFMGGGIEPVATALAWAILYLALYPAVNERCREEINSIVGTNNLSIEHENSLPYFVATIYDILRLSSVAPTAIPHATTEDVKLRSFDIPANTIIFPNLWAANRDPKEWKKPDELYPEHYLTDEAKLDTSATEKMAAFSAGIRRCPGEKFAFYKMFFFLGTIIRRYNIKMVEPPEDMEAQRYSFAKPKPYRISLVQIKEQQKE